VIKNAELFACNLNNKNLGMDHYSLLSASEAMKVFN
jgi:hypothetical protein